MRIGIDIGAQTTKIGAKTKKVQGSAMSFGEYSIVTGIPTNPDFRKAGEEIGRAILDTFGKPEMVAIGCFGPLDYSRKKILKAPNLPGWVGADFRQWEDILGCEVLLDNDANMAIYSEAIKGAGQEYEIVAGFTLGSGVGYGVTMTRPDKGKFIYHGAWDVDAGHMILDPKGPMCGCGQQGCLEAHISRAAIVKRFGKEPHELQYGRDWNWIAHKIAWGIQLVTVIINPDVFILCGGIAQRAGLLAKVEVAYERMLKIYPKEATQTKIALGSFIPHSGIVGAIELAESAK